MKHFHFLLYSLFAAIFFFAQYTTLFAQEFEEEGASIEPIPFQLVDIKPSFQGGEANSFTNWVKSQIIYPETCKQRKIEGRVTVNMIITSQGFVTRARVLKGVHPELDKEAIRISMKSPRWEPGRMGNNPVNVSYTFPVDFELK